MSSQWEKHGKDVEWTDFGFNAWFATSQQNEEHKPATEVDAPPAVRGRRNERPKEELRVLSKSPAPIMSQKSKERRLLQKSLEHRVPIDAKIPIASIRPKSSMDQFLPADNEAAVVSTMSGTAIEIDKDHEDVVAPVSQECDKINMSKETHSTNVADSVQHEERDDASVGSESSQFSAQLSSILQFSPRNELLGSFDAKKQVDSDDEDLLKIASSSNEDLSVYSQGDLARLPVELLEASVDGSVGVFTGNGCNSANSGAVFNEKSAKKCKWWYIVLVLVLLALSVIVAVLGVLLFGGDKNPKNKTSATTTAPPTAAPTEVTSTSQPTLVNLQDLILSVSLDDGAALVDPLSPQSKALAWLDSNTNLESFDDWQKIQRYVLAMFYYSTNGDGWLKHDGWLTDEHECDWFTSDVEPTCDENGAFARLALSSNNISGELPKDLAILSNSLRFIAFQDSNLRGSIPAEYHLLSKLETFQLSHTRLSGSLPTEIALLTKLVSMELNYNAIVGSLPSEIGKLSLLEKLSLQNLRLNGTIPTELGELVSIKNVYLQNNTLTGMIPSELGGLKQLSHLAFQDCALTGAIPPELGKLESLERLWLQGNMLNGTLPVELTQASTLVELVLSRNEISGKLPSEIALWSNLRHLYLDQNKLSATLPSEIGLMRLIEATLSANDFSGSIPTEIANLNQLQLLSLSSDSSSLSGSIPTEFGLLSSLQFLTFYHADFESTIPTEVGLLLDLEVLIIGRTQLTGPIPSEIGNLTGLKRLVLSQNELKGTIPTTIGALTGLMQLSVDQQELFGVIPSELSLLTALDSFDTFKNELTGPFMCPEFIESCAVSCSNGTKQECRMLK